MREISFVKRLKFNFNGSITKRALVIGDADNDQHNELVCANLQGDLAIFKERDHNKFAYSSKLGMVTACAVGDILNSNRNHVAVINMEGLLYIFNVVDRSLSTTERSISDGAHNLELIYEQRMPANCKELLLADLDGDGQNEVIIGLTDRVLRTYKWVTIGPNRGKFVGLYKWEFADQIGSVSLNPSRHENCQDILVAQPGGTYAKLECSDKNSPNSTDDILSSTDRPQLQLKHQSSSESTSDGDNVRTEYVNKLTPEYHQLALAQMRNHHISTEVLGGLRSGRDSDNYSSIVIATLDGTMMLVNKDEILWSLQVGHQLFALAALETESKTSRTTLPQSESTCTIVPTNVDASFSSDGGDDNRNNNSGAQYFVACAWNGKTYLVDEELNYLRFKFDEACSAFAAGNYYLDGKHYASLVYATFNNRIVLYYDVVSDNIRPDYLLNEISNHPDQADLRNKIEMIAKKLNIPLVDEHENEQTASDQTRISFHNFTQDILYSVLDDEVGASLG